MSESAECRKCGESVAVRDGEDHTGFCDGCAQEMIADLVEALEQIRDHEGLDENNCAYTHGRWREHLQDVADEALDKCGLSKPEPGDRR